MSKPLDLDELERQVGAMTPGPWKADLDQFDSESGCEACVTDPKIDMLATIAIGSWEGAKDSQELRDAVGITALRNSAAALLSAARRAEALAEGLREACNLLDSGPAYDRRRAASLRTLLASGHDKETDRDR